MTNKEGKSTLEPRAYAEKARNELIKVAKVGKTITYGDLARKLGVEPEWFGEGFQGWIGQVCEEVSEYEHAHGRYLLSAVAVNQDTKEPGKGFYSLLGVPKSVKGGTEMRRLEFWVDELRKVWEYWKSHCMEH